MPATVGDTFGADDAVIALPAAMPASHNNLHQEDRAMFE